MKKQAKDYERIFAVYLSDRGLISRIYKDLLQLNNSITQKKMGESVNRHFTKSKKHMKRCSVLLSHQRYSNENHKEILIHIHSEECNLKTDNIKYSDDGELLKSSYIAGGNEK